MSVKIFIPPTWSAFTGETRVVEVATTGTIEDVLASLLGIYPNIEQCLYRDGKLKRELSVIVNQDDICFLQNLQTPVLDGDEVGIMRKLGG